MRILTDTYIIIGVALAWIVSFQLNLYFFNTLYINELSSWIFIPSGIRLVSVIIFNELGVIGLFLGALATYYINNYSTGNAFILAFISAMSAFVAISIAKYIFNIDSIFKNLTVKSLLYISLISALTNSYIHLLYLYQAHSHQLISDLIVMFCGDFFGALIMLYLMSFAIKLFKHSYINSK